VSGHAAQVADYATVVAVELGLAPERVEVVRQAGFLHDLGKIALSEQILHKPSKLTDQEYEIVKTHAVIGAELLETSQGLRHLAPFVRHHHERWDGRGYPDELCQEEIPLEARILNVCDSVEAMASDRPYHQGMSLNEVIAEVKRCAGTQFDPAVAEAFIRIVEREGAMFVINSADKVMRTQADKTIARHQNKNGFVNRAVVQTEEGPFSYQPFAPRSPSRPRRSVARRPRRLPPTPRSRS
jgi:putative nucleotidyltransferase with HDIG domain